MRVLSKAHSLWKGLGGFQTYRTSPAFYKVVQFNLSDIGEGIREVTVKDWFVKAGDKVSQFDKVCLVESDKASVSITSRYDGTVVRLYHAEGDVALVGRPLVDIDLGESGQDIDLGESGGQETSLETPQTVSTQTEGTTYSDVDRNKALATPAVRRIAKENNIPIGDVKATGKGGRVLKEDILKHLEGFTDATQQEPIIVQDKKVEITGIKKAMVKAMTKSNNIPTFGYCDEINMSPLIELREDVKIYAKKKGTNVTFMPFFVKALSKALEEYPELNATVDENCENITYKSQHNIGIAMDTERGLIVPNIKNVQSLNIVEISVYLNKLLEKGRTFQLGPSDMAGGTITISNIGIIGGTYLRPLIFPPEVSILALGKTKVIPVFDEDEEVVKRHILNASWAADHRVIDGARIAKLSNTWKEYIENPNFLLMNL